MNDLVERLRTINIFLQPEPSEDLRTFLRENDALRLEAAAELSRLTRELAELREAAMPFVRYIDTYDEGYPTRSGGEQQVTAVISSPYSINDEFAVTLGDLRRLATAAKEG